MRVNLVVLQCDPITLFTVLAVEPVPDGFYVTTNSVGGERVWFVDEYYARTLTAGDRVAVAAITHHDGTPATLACRTHRGREIEVADAVLKFGGAQR